MSKPKAQPKSATKPYGVRKEVLLAEFRLEDTNNPFGCPVCVLYDKNTGEMYIDDDILEEVLRRKADSGELSLFDVADIMLRTKKVEIVAK